MQWGHSEEICGVYMRFVLHEQSDKIETAEMTGKMEWRFVQLRHVVNVGTSSQQQRRHVVEAVHDSQVKQRVANKVDAGRQGHFAIV